MTLRHRMSREWPLAIAILICFGYLWLTEMGILHRTDGVFMYPLDDPFIHMQIARDLAFHGVWGINPGEFASASSSLLYTLLLASLFKIFSASVLIPFLVNIVAALALLMVVHRWLCRQDVKGMVRTAILLGLVIFLPLPVLILSGMEHTLQCLFVFLFVTRFTAALGAGAAGGRFKVDVRLAVYALLITGIRYEGMFLVMMAALVLLYHRRVRASVVVSAAAALPIVIFGFYSIAHGSYFLPNSVLVKSENLPLSLQGVAAFVDNILVNRLTVVKQTVRVVGSPPPGISLLATQRLLLLFPLAYLCFRKVMRDRRDYADMLVVLTGCTVLHLALAATGWLYRYEAYLVMMALVLIPVVFCRADLRSWWPERGEWYGRSLVGVVFFALLFPLVLRSAAAYSNIRQACVNIYQQQYQMARFLAKYHQGDAVAANDIGAISFFAPIRTVDLWGLGSIEVARSKKGGYWTPDFLDSLVRKRGVSVVVVYDEWFDPALLRRWHKVASWTVRENVILGGDTVSFYAINDADVPVLARQLKAFESQLPAGVTAAYQWKSP